ncbi:MAG TPA: hypothetical protein VFA07_08825 [Chthonomonadaceae bacterium]|nr:hypothetical protein [Chthonomonadaceae bacterium]
MAEEDTNLTHKVKMDIIKVYKDPSIIQHLLLAAKPNGFDLPITHLGTILNCPVYRATTTFDYDRCYSYLVLLHQNIIQPDHTKIAPMWMMKETGEDSIINAKLNKIQNWMWLHVSIIAKYYTYQQEVRILEPRSESILERLLAPYGKLINNSEAEKFIQQFFKQKGYVLLSDDILRRRVQNVNLELSEPGEVTVFKCLFFDYDSQPGELFLPPIE